MAQFLTQAQIDSVYELYIGYFNRAPEAGGLNYWSNYYLAQVNAGKTDAAIQKEIANKFYDAAVQYNIYTAGAPVADFIKASYLNALGRTSVDDAGMTYWTAKLTSGEVTRGEFVQKLISDAKGFASDATYGWVSKYLDNRMAVAKAFAAANTTITGDAAITAGKAALSAVTPAAVQAGQTTAQALAAAAGFTSVAGNTFTLTDKIGESVVGTAGNDTFKAVFGATASESTLHIGDSIDGGAGTDTLNLIVSGAGSAAAFPAGATIKNVEIINLDVTAASADFGSVTSPSQKFLNSSTYEGVQQLWQVNTGTASANFDSVTVAADVAAGFRGNGKVGTDAAKAVVTVDAASATQKSLSIALDGVGSGTTLTEGSTAKTETINISGSVAKDTSTTAGVLNLDVGGDALTVNGAFTSDVNIGASITGAKVKTVDLSKSTGGVEINASGLATLETIKGGAGADKLSISMNAAGTNNGSLTTVDLGAGNDTLTFAAATTGANKELSVTLGAGKDTIVTTAVKNVIDTADLTKGLVTVTDFKLGEDTLNLDGAGKVLTAAQLATAKEATTLKAAIDSVAAAIGISKSAVFSYGTDAYVFINDGNAGFAAGDGLIKLVGVDATLLSTNQNGGLVL